jgi:hypothetical protein
MKMLINKNKKFAHGARARRAIAALSALTAIYAASACQSAPEPTDTAPAPTISAPVEAETLSPAEAREQALALLEKLEEAAREELTLDFDDPGQVAGYVERRSELCAEISALALDASDAPAQGLLRTGAEKMTQYLSALPEYSLIRGDGSPEEDEMRREITSVWSAANSDLDKAKALLLGEDGGGETPSPGESGAAAQPGDN